MTRAPSGSAEEPPASPAEENPAARIRLALPVTAVLLAVAAGLVLVASDHWRRGSAVLAGAAVLAMLLRLALSERAAGLLAVRSKPFDVVFLLALAGLLAAMVSLG